MPQGGCNMVAFCFNHACAFQLIGNGEGPGLACFQLASMLVYPAVRDFIGRNTGIMWSELCMLHILELYCTGHTRTRRP